tara:strand:+ start:380 stop:1162 length:783 start_codon:yes stop_codon:yes gene_type:complete
MKLILILSTAILLLSGCSKQKADTNTLVIGMELAYPPFEMTDEQNRPIGVSVDIANALGKHLNRPIRIENIPFAGLIPSLKTGKIDLVISSMTATEERSQSIDFSQPYLKTGLCLLIGINSPIKDLEELNDPKFTYAVKQGTTGHLYATEHLAQSTLLVLEKESAAVLEVIQGKADAFIYDQMSTYMNWKRNPETTRALLTPIKQESWAIGLAKGNPDLLNQVNTFLKEYESQGGFEQLGNKHLPKQKAAFKELKIPFYF